MDGLGTAFDIKGPVKTGDFKLDRPDRKESLPGTDFAAMLKGALDKVNNLQHQQQAAQIALATGSDEISLHEVMVITEQARLALEFTMAVRGKVMDAYNEVMRMQI